MIRLADVFRQFLPDYDALHPRSAQAHKVCQQIEACCTPYRYPQLFMNPQLIFVPE